MVEISRMVTESRNESSMDIDTKSTEEILRIINDEDKKVPEVVAKEIGSITTAVDKISHAFLNGGRLIYIGAGTSGRLGVLDASECPPTYGTPAEMVVGLIAGGEKAILKAVENAEDSPELCVSDLQRISFSNKDILVGIAASGRTPYVIGGLNYAKSLGATTVSISCNPDGEMTKIADIAITPVVGAEVVTGSSRMKAGTAQKLVLNMLTTASMIKIGKVYGNLMVDVEATNEKLVKRQTHIVVEATGVSDSEADNALNQCGRHCKTAIFMILSGLDATKAEEILTQQNGFIRQALAVTQES